MQDFKDTVLKEHSNQMWHLMMFEIEFVQSVRFNLFVSGILQN